MLQHRQREMAAIRKYPSQEVREWSLVPSQAATTSVTNCCPPAAGLCPDSSPLRTGLSSAIDSLLPLGRSHKVLHHPALLPPTVTHSVHSVARHRCFLLFLGPLDSSPSPKTRARTKSLGHTLPGPLMSQPTGLPLLSRSPRSLALLPLCGMEHVMFSHSQISSSAPQVQQNTFKDGCCPTGTGHF